MTAETFRIYSAPFTAGPPNGCVPREELVEETEIEIAEGGRVNGRSRWCKPDGTDPSPCFSGFSAGPSYAHGYRKTRDEAAALGRPDLDTLGFEWECYESRKFGSEWHRVAVYNRSGVTPHAVAAWLRAQAALPSAEREVAWSWSGGRLTLAVRAA